MRLSTGIRLFPERLHFPAEHTADEVRFVTDRGIGLHTAETGLLSALMIV